MGLLTKTSFSIMTSLGQNRRCVSCHYQHISDSSIIYVPIHLGRGSQNPISQKAVDRSEIVYPLLHM